MYLIDTDVIIWYLRGNKKAYDLIETQNGFCVSVITYMELVQGIRNKKELMLLRNSFRNWKVKLLYISEEISAKAMFYVEQNYLSHTLELADALIAATAAVNGLPILTGNLKHYKVIKEIETEMFRQ